MRAFAEMLDRLSLTGSRNAKLVILRDYLAATPDPDRGWALAALTGDLSFRAAKPAMIRAAVQARVDPVLFGWSYDYVGDLAETVALIPSLLYLTMPLSAIVATWPYTDHGLAMLLMASLIAGLICLRGTGSWREWLLLGVCLGGLIGTKYTMAPVALLIYLLWGI